MQVNKKTLIIFLILNLLLSALLLIVSLYLGNTVMETFDRPEEFTFWKKLSYHVGDSMLCYLMAFVYLLPETIRYSLIGGIISYISIYIMTAPITLGLFFLFKRFKGQKT